MTSKQQYRKAYSLLRSATWDMPTLKITCEVLGIGEYARRMALESYSWSQW